MYLHAGCVRSKVENQGLWNEHNWEWDIGLNLAALSNEDAVLKAELLELFHFRVVEASKQFFG